MDEAKGHQNAGGHEDEGRGGRICGDVGGSERYKEDGGIERSKKREVCCFLTRAE